MTIPEEHDGNLQSSGVDTATGADKPLERRGDLADAQNEASVALGWRVKLLRALISGNLKLTQEILLEHVDVLSAPFTRDMPAWSLEWESVHWWMLQSASALFVASCYSQPRIVEWLLRRGADRAAPCYLKQTSLQVVGECCEHSSAINSGGGAEQHRLTAASAECRRLLEAPASLPSPPAVSTVVFTSEYSTEIVRVAALASPSRATAANAGERGGTGVVSPSSRSSNSRASNGPRYVQQKVYACLGAVTWDTPDSNGAMIDKYDLRYRPTIAPSAAAATANDGPEIQQSDADADSGWRMERSTHNRRLRAQRMVLTGCLQFNTQYECALRSWSAAGKGEWGNSFMIQTGASPE